MSYERFDERFGKTVDEAIDKAVFNVDSTHLLSEQLVMVSVMVDSTDDLNSELVSVVLDSTHLPSVQKDVDSVKVVWLTDNVSVAEDCLFGFEIERDKLKVWILRFEKPSFSIFKVNSKEAKNKLKWSL